MKYHKESSFIILNFILILFLNCPTSNLSPEVQPQWLTFSAVKDVPSQKRSYYIKNDKNNKASYKITIEGNQATSFDVKPKGIITLEPGENLTLQLHFNPNSSIQTDHAAQLIISHDEKADSIILRGVYIQKFEGHNESPLFNIVQALGISIDVGGEDLVLGPNKDVLGESIVVRGFRQIDDRPIKITTIARYSPTGNPEFGILKKGKREKLGHLADVSSDYPDAHQSIFPPLEGMENNVMYFEQDDIFHFYYHGKHFISSTDFDYPSETEIKYTSRVYPIKDFQGKAINNAFLVCFEEASNGDYQDAVFLVENIEAVIFKD